MRPIGTLRKIVCNGLLSGDPNCLCIDVEMAIDMDVPRKVPTAGGGATGLEIHLAVLPPPPPPPTLPIGIHSASSSGSPPWSALFQPVQEQKTPLSDWHPPTFVTSTPKQASPVLPTNMLQGEVMTTPTAQATTSLREDDARRYPLTVYHSRRRYCSTPATTRDTRSWLTRHEEHQCAMIRSPSLVDALGLPSTSQGPPGTRDITIPELVQSPAISPSAGGVHSRHEVHHLERTGAPQPAPPRGCGTVPQGVGGQMSYAFKRLCSLAQITAPGQILVGEEKRPRSELRLMGDRGVLLAWKASSFDQEMTWRRRHIVAVRLSCRADDRHLIIASAYGPAIPKNQ